MGNAKMHEVIDAVTPGDILEIEFGGDRFNGRYTAEDIYSFLKMCAPQGVHFRIGGWTFADTLQTVADTGEWNGFRIYELEILEGFDPKLFFERASPLDLKRIALSWQICT